MARLVLHKTVKEEVVGMAEAVAAILLAQEVLHTYLVIQVAEQLNKVPLLIQEVNLITNQGRSPLLAETHTPLPIRH